MKKKKSIPAYFYLTNRNLTEKKCPKMLKLRHMTSSHWDNEWDNNYGSLNSVDDFRHVVYYTHNMEWR